ncbi:DUF6706 family protein [Mariniphaga sediminis]|uniref:DUF6706 family protein n=1 Tax=Mariniphaga sediminis TaxID=1628158 RepID=UPI0035670765
MTILEAIKESVGYPISDNRANMTLTKRGLAASDEATQAVLNSKAFELGTADLMFWLITAPNVREGGYSLSISDKKTLKELASGIYSKWGVADPTKATIKFISPW